MTDSERVNAYELQIEDFLRELQKRLEEFDEGNKLSPFEQGRQLAYFEVQDMLKTRYGFLREILED